MFVIKKIVFQAGNKVKSISVDHTSYSAIIYNNNIDDTGMAGFLVMNADGFRALAIFNPIYIKYDESVYDS